MRALAAVLFLIVICCQGAHAVDTAHDENADLSLIPAQLEQVPSKDLDPATSVFKSRFYLEDAFTGWSNRNVLWVPIPVAQPSVQNRLSLDANVTWQPREALKFVVSDRLNGFVGDGFSFPMFQNIRNDFREGYFSYELMPRTFLEAGRLNLKNGVALGFNPTDFFKTRTQVSLASIDPSALKEDRLGVLMIEAQKIWDHGSLTLAYAPRTQSPSPLLFASPLSFDPLFGQSNGEDRFLAAISYDLEQFNPQALLYVDSVGTHLGLNVSRVLGSSFVLYGEWAGVESSHLSARATSFGQATGSLPPTATPIPQTQGDPLFQNDVAMGLSWTSSFKLTANLEYHFHQAGFNSADFSQWINLGSSSTAVASQLWFVRQYASDQQELLTQHQLFFRLDWPDWFLTNLTFGAVAFLSPYEGSTLAQLSAKYFVSKSWTVGTYLAASLGGLNTVEGSIPWWGNGVLQVVRYF